MCCCTLSGTDTCNRCLNNKPTQMFEGSRGLTKEESYEYAIILDRLGTPTGKNFFDIY